MRADELAEWLGKQGIGVDALHGDMRQYIRQKVIRKFKAGTLKVLVATDVAARGIDMSGLRLVINFDLPETVDTYIHRIGRTGRAGREGEALSICAVVDQEKLAAILAKVGDRLVITDSNGKVVDDFVPERSPRARKGRGRPPRGQRQPGRPANARANKRPAAGKLSGKPSEKPSGKPSGKPSFDGKKKKGGGKYAAQDAGASPGPKKPYSDKPRSDRSDKPRSDKPYGDKPRSDKPYAGKPKHGKNNTGKHESGKNNAGKHKNAGNERVEKPAAAPDGQDGGPSRQRLTKARLNQTPKRGGKPPAKGAGRGADKQGSKGPSAQRLRGGGEGRLRRRRTG
jgi:ATP-dependent RNA helicase RhlE